MNKLRVIVVTPEAPDPFGNSAARWYFALAKGLLRLGHAVRFLGAYSENADDNSLRRAKDLCAAMGLPLSLYPHPRRPWLKQKWNTLRRPYSYFISDQLRGDLQRALQDGYDILNLEQMWAGYLGMGNERALLSVHHLELLDLAGVTFHSLKTKTAKRLMFRAERHILAQSCNIRVTTDRLSGVVAGLNPNARIFTVPVAIDTDLYRYVPVRPRERTVGLIASFDWMPGYNAGVRLVTRIWPRVRKIIPDARLLLVGWSARKALAQYLGDASVTVIENVPDAKQYFLRLSALLYPLSQGSGMKLKLLEAMAYGTPLVTTHEGAEGLTVTDGYHAFVADDDDAFAEKTARLLLDKTLAEKISRAARALVDECYSPMPVVDQMQRVYESILSGAPTKC